MSKIIDENTVLIDKNKKLYLVTKTTQKSTCTGCYARDNKTLCHNLPVCTKYMRQDKQHVVYIPKILPDLN